MKHERSKTENAPFYRTFLSQELSKRIELNPRYSMRRFAQLLHIASGSLSQIMSGHRSPSTQIVERMFRALDISEDSKKEFIQSLLAEKRTLGKKRVTKKLDQLVNTGLHRGEILQHQTLDQEHFRMIADWYHFAIWEMVERKDFKPQSFWIAKRLGITTTEAKLGFDRLVTLGLVTQVNGRWQKSTQRIQTKDFTKTSEARQRRQKQVLEKAIEALQTVPIDRRHYSTITINIDPNQIPKMRERIQEMIWTLAEEFKAGKQKQVYEIALQIFPTEKADPGIKNQ